MATPANISLNNLGTPLTLTISHDGSPDTILELLTKFYDTEKTSQNFETFEELYLELYSRLPKHDAKIMEGDNDNALWEYHIDSASNLKVFCSESWHEPINGKDYCNPLDYVMSVTDDAVMETTRSILKSLRELEAIGINICLPNVSSLI